MDRGVWYEAENLLSEVYQRQAKNKKLAPTTRTRWRAQGEEGTMSMTLSALKMAGVIPRQVSFSTLIAFGPILPAMLITCHQARAQARAKHVHLIFV